MDNATLEIFVADLARSGSTDELKSVCEAFCQRLGIPWYLIGVVSPRSLAAPTINFLSNYPEPWVTAYFEGRKHQSDPVVAYMLRHNAPVYWSRLLQQEAFQTPEHHALMQEASRHGLLNGLSVPIHTPTGDAAVFSLALDKEGEDGVAELSAALPYAQSFATHLLERYIRILETSEAFRRDAKLSPREQDALFWACEGKTTWEIAQILEIKERTVEFHLQNATTKLGASNRQHAVSLAMMLGLIKPRV